MSPQLRLFSSPVLLSLEHRPPIPLLFQHERPLHGLFGFAPKRNVVIMSLRDPGDTREMPPNSNTSVNAFCVRGVRKVRYEFPSYEPCSCVPS
jgi:hypothetical protein